MAGGPRSATAAGVTIIVHGSGSTSWVAPMAAAIRGSLPVETNLPVYQVTMNGSFGVTVFKVAGDSPLTNRWGEALVLLDWSALASVFGPYVSTEDTARAIVARLVQTNLIAEFNGHSVAELPLHLIGQGRGGSLVCAMAKHFGMAGLWVDQVTLTDPHPVNNDGNTDPLPVIDAPLRIYQNVLFADNYFETVSAVASGPTGQAVSNAYNRFVPEDLPGGYGLTHYDMHLWYHGTIDFRDPADDGAALLYASNRPSWYNAYEQDGARTGFYYSSLGGGNRRATNQPAGAGSDPIVRGFNQFWDLGAGIAGNRTPLPSNDGTWPNVITLDLTATNVVAQGGGFNGTVRFQWAKPSSNGATLSLYLDEDLNPFNTNAVLLDHFALAGTTSNTVTTFTTFIPVPSTNGLWGARRLYAKVTDGTHTRYCYAAGPVTVVSSLTPPQLQISRAGDGSVDVEVVGTAGQRLALETSTDLLNWSGVATNWLTTNRWSYPDPLPGRALKAFRAVLR